MRIRSQESGPRLPFMITMTLVLLACVSELFSQGTKFTVEHVIGNLL